MIKKKKLIFTDSFSIFSTRVYKLSVCSMTPPRWSPAVRNWSRLSVTTHYISNCINSPISAMTFDMPSFTAWNRFSNYRFSSSSTVNEKWRVQLRKMIELEFGYRSQFSPAKKTKDLFLKILRSFRIKNGLFSRYSILSFL